jgi:hypothetical protein
MAVVTSTSSSLLSIVRCVAVGNPALATTCVSSDAAPRRSLAAFTGAVFLADAVLLAGAGPPMMRLLPSAVTMARPRSMALAMSTSSSSSSIVRCVAAGIPALATTRVLSDAAPMRSLAAFPGAIFLAGEIMPAGAGPPMMRSLPSAVAMERPRSMVVATSTSSSSSSIVRCVAVGNPALATTCVSSDAAPRRSLAAFTGAVFLADAVLPAGARPPMMRSLPSAVAMARPLSMAVATSTSSSCRPS